MVKILLTSLFIFFSGIIFGQGLDLDSPDLDAAPKSESGPSFLDKISLGGAFDIRFLSYPGQDTGKGIIHVNEFVVTVQVTDNISLLAEQILPMSKLQSGVAQDHGFVYATFTNLPLIGPNGSLKIGRFRGKFGQDSNSDAAANIMKSLVYRNLGVITDTGVELGLILGHHFDVKINVQNGSDYIKQDIFGTRGSATVDSKNKSRPVIVRVEGEFSEVSLALSYFNGPSFLVTNRLKKTGTTPRNASQSPQGYQGAILDESKIIHKQRAAFDFLFRIGKSQFTGEFTYGKEKDQGKEVNPMGGLLRWDHSLVPAKWKIGLQWDVWSDDRATTEDEHFISGAVTRMLGDETLIRLGGIRSLDSKGDWVGGLQVLLAY